MTNERVAELRHLRNLLKTGEYEGTDIMLAWIAIAEYADLLEKGAAEPNAPQLVTVCKWIVDTAREIPGQANEVAVTREFIGKLRQLIESRPTEPKAEGHHCPSCQCPELDQAGFPVNR